MSDYLCHVSVDRIVDGKLAVLIPYDSGDGSDGNGCGFVPGGGGDWVVPVGQLPGGTIEGVILKVFHNHDGTYSFQIDSDTTMSARARIKAKMDILNARSRDRNK